jgi:hypothetical protein
LGKSRRFEMAAHHLQALNRYLNVCVRAEDMKVRRRVIVRVDIDRYTRKSRDPRH